ncbi:MAG TPA: hypothetical protein VES67_00370 [Vicinamibacterales bacterium]|nr:hypothetical protein [Vicinamibacterales bacterium]
MTFDAPAAIVTPEAGPRTTSNDSSGSVAVSPMIVTVILLLICPGMMLREPLAAT